MSRTLSSYEKNLVSDNQGLVHFLVKNFGINQISSDYDDFVSIGNFGLIKAATTFDSSRNIKFSSYASVCIKNQIFTYYQNYKKYANNISLFESTENDEKFTLDYSIEDSNLDFVQKVEDKEIFIELVNIILNYLEGKSRIAILYELADLPQKYIAKILNISKSYASIIIKKAFNEIRNVFNSKLCYKRVFSMEIVGDEYRISFYSEDISNFNKNFSTFLQNILPDEKLPNFKVACNNGRIIIQLPACSDSFSFIAQIIQEIGDFSMHDVSNKN